jgi:hypothetical protein
MRGKSPAGVYTPTHSSDIHPASGGQRQGNAREIKRARVMTEKRKLPEAGRHVSRKGETAKVPLLRPLAAGSEFQRNRRHLRAPHEKVQYAEHAARNLKDKGTKPRRDARAAGRARQRRLGRRPRIHRQARARNARPPCPPRNTTPQGNVRSAEPPAPKHAGENLQNSASPQSKK